MCICGHDGNSGGRGDIYEHVLHLLSFNWAQFLEFLTVIFIKGNSEVLLLFGGLNFINYEFN